MAAARVFDTPELLEQILLQVAVQSLHSEEGILHPAYRLYVLQRVNCTFRDGIRSSTWLQNRMKPSTTELPHAADQSLTSLRWLAQVTGLAFTNVWSSGKGDDSSWGFRSRRSVASYGPDGAAHLHECIETAFGEPSASWRKIPVSAIPDSRRLRIGICFDGAPVHRNGYMAIWEWEKGFSTTLGQIFDEYSKLYSFNAREHWKYKMMYERKVRQISSEGEDA